MKTRVAPPLPEYLKFLSVYTREITDLALATRVLVLEESPGATELIYDAYSAVAAGYSFTGRSGDAFIHVAVYARWVNLGFNFGSQLEDPDHVLQGSGNWVRHIRISEPEDLERPEVRRLVRAAVAAAERGGGAHREPKSVVRAIYKKKRRPDGTGFSLSASK